MKASVVVVGVEKPFGSRWMNSRRCADRAPLNPDVIRENQWWDIKRAHDDDDDRRSPDDDLEEAIADLESEPE